MEKHTFNKTTLTTFNLKKFRATLFNIRAKKILELKHGLLGLASINEN